MGLTLESIARFLGAEFEGDGTYEVSGIATLRNATAEQLTFLANPNYRKYLAESRAGIVILQPALAGDTSTNKILVKNPYEAYARVSQLFARELKHGLLPAGIAPTAEVAETASIAVDVNIGPGAVISEGVQIGEGATIGAGTFVGADSVIGAHSTLRPRVTVYHGVKIGARVVVHSGAVIGADGFGFAPSPAGYVKIEQLGGVVIEDDVEIGANTTIDRGALDDTFIGQGAKLDNQIQIAHNVRIGAHTVIAACVGISGSSEIGEFCMLGGGVGIAGHLQIADRVQITGMSLVTGNIKEPGTYSSGTGSEPNQSWRKNAARFRQLDAMARRLSKLEKSLKTRT